MKKDTFIQDNLGKDKIPGRPIRLNVKTLQDNNPGYAEILFFSDLHLGHPQCKLDEAKKMLNWALEKKTYVLCLGDLIEAGLRDSIGDSVYSMHGSSGARFKHTKLKAVADTAAWLEGDVIAMG